VNKWERWVILLAAACVAYPVLWTMSSHEPLPFGSGAGIGQFTDLRIGGACLLEMLLLVAVAFLPRFRRQQFVLGSAAGMAIATGFALIIYVGGGGMFFIVASMSLCTIAQGSYANGS